VGLTIREFISNPSIRPTPGPVGKSRPVVDKDAIADDLDHRLASIPDAMRGAA